MAKMSTAALTAPEDVSLCCVLLGMDMLTRGDLCGINGVDLGNRNNGLILDGRHVDVSIYILGGLFEDGVWLW